MPKTNFINGDASQGLHGTRVVAEFLNAVNNHHHTGLDEDGHGGLPYADDIGTANAYIVNLIPALTQYVSGMPLYFKAAAANTGTSTINVNGLGIKAIKNKNNQDLEEGDIQSGQIVMLVFDGLNFQLIGSRERDAHTVDGYHAASTATANTIPVLNAGAKFPGSITGDADTVDGYHASAAPAANIVPVSGASGTLARGFIPDIVPGIMTGEAFTISGTGSTHLDLGTVTAGDRILATCGVLISSITAGNHTWAIDQSGGTAFVNFDYGSIAAYTTSYLAASGSAYMRVVTVCKVITSGTLTLRSANGGVPGAPSYSGNHIYAVFLKKQ